MIRPNTRLLAAAIGFLVGATALAPAVRAQEATGPDQAPMEPLTRAQLEAFADLVGDASEVVSLRLLSDPGMVPLAAEASDARVQRQRRGRTMVILGYTGFGVGAAVAILGGIAWSNFDSSKCSSEDQSGCNFDGLLGLGLIALGGGLLVGGLVVSVIGSNKLAKPSEAETQALERYDPLRAHRPPVLPPSYSLALPAGPSGKAFSLPLLSLTF